MGNKLVQINTVINSGSTGHIAEEIGKCAIEHDWQSIICFGRNPKESLSKSYKIGSKFNMYINILLTRLFDSHGDTGSFFSTKKLIKYLESVSPDIIQLHNIHGYYLNFPLLFSWLAKTNIKVVWTLHDCWSFTGHCAFYSFNNCTKWTTGCNNCGFKKNYPASFFMDNSKKNYLKKKQFFKLPKNVNLVVPSAWLQKEVRNSFLGSYNCTLIPNGINLDMFYPRKVEKTEKKIILGVANTWEKRKGLNDFIQLAKTLDSSFEIVLIGLSEKQIKILPSNIKGIIHTESQNELAEWYSKALVYFNPSVEETQGLTTIESMACGTPVVVYNKTAVPECVTNNTGFIVDEGNIESVKSIIMNIADYGKEKWSKSCIEHVVKNYDQKKNFEKYIELYKNLVNSN